VIKITGEAQTKILAGLGFYSCLHHAVHFLTAQEVVEWWPAAHISQPA